jgi:hypothetical protein
MKMSKFNAKMLAMVMFIAAAVAIAGCAGRAVIPTNYNTYNSPDGTFKIQYPAEWTSEGGSKGQFAWAKFTSGHAEIEVDSNAIGSLISNMVTSSDPQDTAPVAGVHEFERQGFEDDDASHKEEKAVPVLTGMSDARKSEFTTSTAFGGSVHGYRVTTLTNDKRVRIICKCPESEWKDLKPAFDKIIASLAMGKS